MGGTYKICQLSLWFRHYENQCKKKAENIIETIVLSIKSWKLLYNEVSVFSFSLFSREYLTGLYR